MLPEEAELSRTSFRKRITIEILFGVRGSDRNCQNRGYRGSLRRRGRFDYAGTSRIGDRRPRRLGGDLARRRLGQHAGLGTEEAV